MVILLWAGAWIAMGVAVAGEVRDLARLGDTVVELGEATRDAGQGLRSLEALPLVGDQVAEPAASVREAGEAAVRSGEESRDSAERLGLLLGASIGLIPTVSLLALYLPFRIGDLSRRSAERRRIAAEPRRHGADRPA